MYPVFIYTLNCPTTGIVRYLGQTENPDRRFSNHLSDARRETYYCARWIKKLLSKNLRPIMEIIDVVPDTEADFWEREYIQNFREWDFNLTNFSEGGEAPMRGKKHSPESNEKNRLAHVGKKPSAETRGKLSLANSGEKNRLFGKKLPKETCAKISAAMLGNKNALGKKKI